MCTTECPIWDSTKCRSEKDADGNHGPAHYWAPEDFKNFFKAFFRNFVLTEAFLKPEFGGNPDLYIQP